MLHASLLTCLYFIFWSRIRNTAVCHKLRNGGVRRRPSWTGGCWLASPSPSPSSARPGPYVSLKTREKKAPGFKFWGLSGKAELLVLVFAGGWCQKEERREAAGSRLSVLFQGSVVNTGDQSGEKAGPASCVAGRSRGSGFLPFWSWTDAGFRRTLCLLFSSFTHFFCPSTVSREENLPHTHPTKQNQQWMRDF